MRGGSSAIKFFLLFATLNAVPALAEPSPSVDSTRHWSFIPPTRPAVPKVDNSAWVRNPIDAFILSEQETHGLIARPQADKSTLLRRVYLDLIGLAPTRDELHAFLADSSPDAYERIVDKLLASPRYGERWGRHWMDVWRYSDWAGYGAEIRDSQPFLWRWRDWIVESLNADKGYDRMVQEMLAGDEIAPGDPQTTRATGYLCRSYYKFNRNVWLENAVEHTSKAFLGMTMNCAKCHDHKYDPLAQKEHYQFRAIFETYNIRTDPAPGELDTKKDGFTQVYDADAAAKTVLFIRGNEATPDTEALSPAVPACLGGTFVIHPIQLPVTAWYPGARPSVQHDLLAADEAAICAAEVSLATGRKALVAARKAIRADVTSANARVEDELEGVPTKPAGALPAAASGAVKYDAKAAEVALRAAQRDAVLAEYHVAEAKARRAADEARIAADNARYAVPPAANANELALAAGKAELEAKVVKAEEELYQALSSVQFPPAPAISKAPAAKTKVPEKKPVDAFAPFLNAIEALDKPAAIYAPLTPVYPTTSSGRRLALAKWITSRQNPLAARVAVNHIWMRHFGEPFVETVFDFGKNGKRPTHPQLLDWLAVELMDHGWSMKHLHRLIVTSSTYRVESGDVANDANVAIDPDNKYLWRMNSRRLESEAVRDNLLSVTGQLDLTMGGPELDQNSGLTNFRRSIYFRCAAEKQVVFLKLFDGANPAECYRRLPTVMPQQALALANSPLAQSAARKLAADLTKQTGTGEPAQAAFVTATFEQILGRQPSSVELAACESFLTGQVRRLKETKSLVAFASGDAGTIKPSAEPHQRAREDLVQVLLNHNDFVTIR
jgi:hypothetical protein